MTVTLNPLTENVGVEVTGVDLSGSVADADVDVLTGALQDHLVMVVRDQNLTPVQYLAALGLPTWVLLSATPDWRWQHGGATSPWYPTARLFRDAPGGGATAVGQAADELRKSGAGGTPG